MPPPVGGSFEEENALQNSGAKEFSNAELDFFIALEAAKPPPLQTNWKESGIEGPECSPPSGETFFLRNSPKLGP